MGGMDMQIRPRAVTGRPVPPLLPRAVARRTAVLRFPDFDAYTTGITVGRFEMFLTGPDSGRWTRATARLDRGRITFGEEGGANVGHSRIPGWMVVLHVSISGTPSVVSGLLHDRSSLLVHGPGAHHFEAVQGPTRWATLAVDPGLLEEARRDLGLPGPAVRRGERRAVEVPPARMRTLRRVLARARRTIHSRPAALRRASPRARLQRDLARAFARALFGGRPVAGPDATEERRHRILVAAMEHLASSPDDVVTLSGLCEAIGTAPRSLHRVFRWAFRQSPARYLRLRRMGQVRTHLKRGAPPPGSVTEAALRFGFPELGRFAGAYRRLFGESPSATLGARRRSPAARAQAPPPGGGARSAEPVDRPRGRP
jgi:AraC-like DNA-binding protein